MLPLVDSKRCADPMDRVVAELNNFTASDFPVKAAALWYADHGFSVIPVQPNKRPYVKWEQFQKQAATREQIEKWWQKWPDADVGLVTGQVGGITVIDADSADGIEALQEFLPDTLLMPEVKTPKGQHFYFEYEPGIANQVRTIKDTDVRNDGGYVVAPPSINEAGSPYTWIEGLKISEMKPPRMPAMLADLLRQGSTGRLLNNNSRKKASRGVIGGTVTLNGAGTENTPLTPPARVIGFEKGFRDDTLFHIAACLHRGGMNPENISKTLHLIGASCSPPFPVKEIQDKINSVLKRSRAPEKGLTDELREFISVTNGSFTVTEALGTVTNRNRKTRASIRAILARLVKEGLIERVPPRDGVFRRIEAACDVMDFRSAQCQIVDMWLPFGLHNLVEILPGNIIVVAGEANAGKTALLLNMVMENMHKFDVHYFNSEMGASELRKRLEAFPNVKLDDWCFTPYERSENFADVIRPGLGKINIIDFMEIHKDFWEIGGRLAEIHRKLDEAVAVIALQKNKNVETGLGGSRGLEKPRLYLSLEHERCTIVKAKNWKTERNPNGLQISFRIRKGCVFHTVSKWEKPNGKGH